VKLLLDTHCWLWAEREPKKLGPRTRALLTNLEHEVYLSVASAWEIVLKVSKEKLRLPSDAATYVRSRLRRSHILALDISLDHVLALSSLPILHRDPFDRILVAQAQTDGMTLVTADREIPRYNVFIQDATK